MEFLETCISYSCLGYDITLTSIYYKQGIRMVKRYSHTAERPLTCEQVFDHEKLKDPEQLYKITQFLYEDIIEQEKTGKYYDPQGR